jgi:hypothetical protein
LNELVDFLRTLVFKHETLKNQEKPISTPSSFNAVQAAQHRAEETSRQATKATADAEKANNEGLKILDQIKAEQSKSRGVVSEQLVNRSLAQTLIIYVKNTAAVIKVDEATAALIELEDLLEM